MMEAEKLEIENQNEETRGMVLHLEKELQNITKGLNELTDLAKMRAKDVDKRIHDKPYWFLAGAVGVGYLLAKWTKSNH